MTLTPRPAPTARVIFATRIPDRGAYIPHMVGVGKKPAESLLVVACAAAVACLVPLTSAAEGVANSPPPFAGFAIGQDGERQQREWHDALDAAAEKPGAPPPETIERMKREPPRPG